MKSIAHETNKKREVSLKRKEEISQQEINFEKESYANIAQLQSILGNRSFGRLIQKTSQGRNYVSNFGPTNLIPAFLSASSPLSPIVMRAILIPDQTQLATVNTSMPLMNIMGPGATSLGNLSPGDTIRILDRITGGNYIRIHVETGALRGQIGYIQRTSGNITISPSATSQRTLLAGTENAYAQLTIELTRRRPRRNEILDIFNNRLTAAQRLRLLQPGDANYTRLQRTSVISPRDFMHILGICGAPLRRKLTDYLNKRGTKYTAQIRLAFATANDNERLDVARDDRLVGSLSTYLRTVHPEIVFGTVISQLYPANGDINALIQTNPNLGRWLQRFTQRGANIRQAAVQRAGGLAAALQAMNTQPATQAYPLVITAVRQAPRGMALPSSERTALDAIEGRAYADDRYRSADMGMMFLTRWGRPLRNITRIPKTFIHQAWRALRQLPQDAVLLNNAITYIAVNTDPQASGSFSPFLENAREFGEILYDWPQPSHSLHAASAVQNSRNIIVREREVDIFRPGMWVRVTTVNNTLVTARIIAVNVRRRQLTLSLPVTVQVGAEVRRLIPGDLPLHASRNQNSYTISVNEPHVNIYRPGTTVSVQLANGTTITATVMNLSASARRLRLSRRVQVNRNAEIRGVTSSVFERGEAVRVIRSTALYGDSNNAPDLNNRLGTLNRGVVFARTGQTTVGTISYFSGIVHEGRLRRAEGWLLAADVVAYGGGTTTMREVEFASTVRHEVGHSVDLQIDGFSRFSAVCAARWIKYTNIDDWIRAVIAAGNVVNPNTTQTFNNVSMSFTQAARTFSNSIQQQRTNTGPAVRARRWLQGWQTAGGSQDIYNTITQFDVDPRYYRHNNIGLPNLGSRVYAAHYRQWLSFIAQARDDSLAAGISSYAFTSPFEFFAVFYSAYFAPGQPPNRFARAVPSWALNFFDRLARRQGAGPPIGTQ